MSRPRPGSPIRFQCRGRCARSSGGRTGEGVRGWGPRDWDEVRQPPGRTAGGKGIFGPSRRAPDPSELSGPAALAGQPRHNLPLRPNAGGLRGEGLLGKPVQWDGVRRAPSPVWSQSGDTGVRLDTGRVAAVLPGAVILVIVARHV